MICLHDKLRRGGCGNPPSPEHRDGPSCLGCAQHRWTQGCKVGGLVCQTFHLFHVSPDAIPLFSCFTSWHGQEDGTVTLRHWDHAVVALITFHLTFISQCPLLERSPRLQAATLVAPNSCHQLLALPEARESCEGGLHPTKGGSEGCSLYDQACFGAAALPCQMTLEGWLQRGTSICCQIFGWRNIPIMPCHEAAAACQKTATIFIQPSR